MSPKYICFDSDIPPGVSSNRDKVEDCKNARKIQPGWEDIMSMSGLLILGLDFIHLDLV